MHTSWCRAGACAGLSARAAADAADAGPATQQPCGRAVGPRVSAPACFAASVLCVVAAWAASQRSCARLNGSVHLGRLHRLLERHALTCCLKAQHPNPSRVTRGTAGGRLQGWPTSGLLGGGGSLVVLLDHLLQLRVGLGARALLALVVVQTQLLHSGGIDGRDAAHPGHEGVDGGRWRQAVGGPTSPRWARRASLRRAPSRSSWPQSCPAGGNKARELLGCGGCTFTVERSRQLSKIARDATPSLPTRTSSSTRHAVVVVVVAFAGRVRSLLLLLGLHLPHLLGVLRGGGRDSSLRCGAEHEAAAHDCATLNVLPALASLPSPPLPRARRACLFRVHQSVGDLAMRSGQEFPLGRACVRCCCVPLL